MSRGSWNGSTACAKWALGNEHARLAIVQDAFNRPTSEQDHALRAKIQDTVSRKRAWSLSRFSFKLSKHSLLEHLQLHADYRLDWRHLLELLYSSSASSPFCWRCTFAQWKCWVKVESKSLRWNEKRKWIITHPSHALTSRNIFPQLQLSGFPLTWKIEFEFWKDETLRRKPLPPIN